MADDKEPVGRARGAIALAEKLTPDERRLRASKGAAARWKKQLLATHKGNFKEQLGIDVECYVLNDPAKTAVISQGGLARALGMSNRGKVFERFISSQGMGDFVVAELAQKLQNPLTFQWVDGVAQTPPITALDLTASQARNREKEGAAIRCVVVPINKEVGHHLQVGRGHNT